MKIKLPAVAALALLLPFTMAVKCVDYDPGQRLAATVVDAGSGGSGDAHGAAISKPCDEPNTARLRVENFAFNIQCGCQETTGKKCTVPLGTTVHWQFADSTSHNITSTFGMSADTMSGTFTYTFTTAGAFKYGCAIHSLDMSGYQIVVEGGP